MSIQATAWAIDQAVPGTGKLVLMALANHAEHTTGRSFASIEDISKEASCTQRAAFAYLMALQRNGYVARRVLRGANGRKERRYWLRFDRQPAPWVSSHDAEDADLAEVSRPDEKAPQSTLSTSVPAGFRTAKQAAALQEAEEARKQQQIFVFEGSAGWIAWLDYRARTTGIRSLPTCWGMVDGRRRLGWWLPSLYPPREPSSDHQQGVADAAAPC